MAVVSELETELKYEAGDDLPPLADLPGISGVEGPQEVRLSAVYYDTADQRLARHGATLRRRTGGADEGWHLKVPVGGDSRVELRLPLDSAPATNAPPEELAELTFGMTRGIELRPVAQLKTKRRTWRLTGPGGLVAEVADDRVTARRLDSTDAADKWHELEVELADPAAGPALDRALRKAGLRRSRHRSKLARVMPPPESPSSGDTAGEVLLAYLRTQVDELVKQDLRVRRDEDDSVHRMRVACRRLRSVLRVYKRLLPGTARVRDDLKWLGRQLSPSRDLEVQYEHLRAEVASLPEELVVGPVEARLTRYFGPAQAGARETVLKALGDKRYRRLLDELDRLADLPMAPHAARPAKELGRHARRARRRIDEQDTLHDTRKAAKRYRYALEVASPGSKKRRRAKKLTKLLGEYVDGSVAQPMLRELGMQAHLAGENGFTFGILHERERARAARVVGTRER
ncbi:CYTH and CHAD domain-containing protein [Actinophytocola oryzae]|uniref:CHAD domain-containing protein n=1 Tax=Actinophytocola oryzae TaxID=502181 RepID=A0A4R7VUF9_9PSEU|nr:CYTH and CHAD domain-containing protein [Actinophytocola oryzae]TDV53596.1 CHAD domain-containing protein [Actinophytocola oryzae]